MRGLVLWVHPPGSSVGQATTWRTIRPMQRIPLRPSDLPLAGSYHQALVHGAGDLCPTRIVGLWHGYALSDVVIQFEVIRYFDGRWLLLHFAAGIVACTTVAPRYVSAPMDGSFTEHTLGFWPPYISTTTIGRCAWTHMEVGPMIAAVPHLRFRMDLFDSTLGYPGEGPRKQKLPQQQRSAVDLTRPDILITEQTRRDLARAVFCNSLDVSFEHFISLGAKAVGQKLAQYGQMLYDRGDAVGTYVDTILAVSDADRSLRHQLSAAWDVAGAWKRLMPWSNHIPTPPSFLLAMFSLSVCWGWLDMAAFILISFTGMLRPGEALRLTRADILLPSDLLSTRRVCFVKVTDPKNRRIAARREHARIDDYMVVDFLEAWLPRLQPSQRLFPFKAAQMRKLHDQLVGFFGVPTEDGRGLTPASHRGGGATLCFERTGDLELTRWRGRWSSTTRTLEIYIQEVAAASVLPALDASHRSLVLRFAKAAHPLWQDLMRQVLAA